MRLFLALALSALLALPAAARPLAGDEARSLGRAIDSYLAAIGRNDATRIVAFIPPRVLNVFAGHSGIEAKNLESTLVKQTRTLLKGWKFTDLSADRSALDAQDAALADGTRVTWVVIPTSFVAETKDGKTRNDQPLLALREGKRWYMLRIEGSAQGQIAGFAYPFLQKVSFPPPRSVPID